MIYTILAFVLGYMLVKHAIDVMENRDKERLRILEDALRDGDMDDETKEQLMQGLAGRRAGGRMGRAAAARASAPVVSYPASGWMKFIAFVGWIVLCLGVAFIMIATCTRAYGMEAPAAVLTCLGFGLTTYPFVIRELQSVPRRSAPDQAS